MQDYIIDPNRFGRFWVFGPRCESGRLFVTETDAKRFVSHMKRGEFVQADELVLR